MRHKVIHQDLQLGRLITICESVVRDKSKSMQYWCECLCGEICSVTGASLRSGNTKSCGCLQREQARLRKITHGFRYTPEYRAYHAAKNRCTNQGDINYQWYGNRGIQFKFTSFEEFYRELGSRPDGMTLDRIDNNGHYIVGNVRWATKSQQAFNRRPKRKLVVP